MLRIIYSRTDSLHRWTLCGKLAGPWVQELRACWEQARVDASALVAIVDLSDVTFIDESGARLLSEMRKAGVEFLAAGVETTHLLQNLNPRGARPIKGC